MQFPKMPISIPGNYEISGRCHLLIRYFNRADLNRASEDTDKSALVGKQRIA
jgi:hypothetical protein